MTQQSGGTSYPGVTGVDSGLAAEGPIKASNVIAGDPATGTGDVSSAQNDFYGATTFNDTPDDNDNFVYMVEDRQTTELTQDCWQPAHVVTRNGTLAGFKYVFGTHAVRDLTGQTDGILAQGESKVATGPGAGPGGATASGSHLAYKFFSSGSAIFYGGLGVFGHAAPSAPRTLAQATIDAITDANAKTAVQAVANALADSGALTLT